MMRPNICSLIAGLSVLACCLFRLQAQGQAPFVKILSPSNNAVVKPGQKLKVTVSTSGDLRALAIYADDPLGIHPLMLGRRSCTLKIPEDTPLGPLGITADGRTKDGKDVTDELDVDVERDDTPLAVSTSLGHSVYLEEGQKPYYVAFLATYRGDVEVEVNDSTRNILIPQNMEIVKVNATGELVPLRAGRTGIMVAGGCCVQVIVMAHEPR